MLADGDVIVSVDNKAEAVQLIRHTDDWVTISSNGHFHLAIFVRDLLASQTRERESTRLYEELSSSSSVLCQYCTLPEWEALKE